MLLCSCVSFKVGERRGRYWTTATPCFLAAADQTKVRHLLSVPFHKLTPLVISFEDVMQSVPLLFVLLEMLLRSSRASSSSKLQALRMITILTPQCDPVIIFPSLASMLPLLGALVTSSKVFNNTNWDFESLAAASELLLLLIKQTCELAVRISADSQHLYEQNQQQQQNGQEAGQECQQQQDEGKDQQKQQQHKQRGKGQEQQQGSAECFKDEQQQQDQAGQATGKGEGHRKPRENQQQLSSGNAEGLTDEASAPSSAEATAAAAAGRLQGLCWAACHGLLGLASSWADMADMAGTVHRVSQQHLDTYQAAAAHKMMAAGAAAGSEHKLAAAETTIAGGGRGGEAVPLQQQGFSTTAGGTATGSESAPIWDISAGLDDELCDAALIALACGQVRNVIQESGVHYAKRKLGPHVGSASVTGTMTEVGGGRQVDHSCLWSWVVTLSAAAVNVGDPVGANSSSSGSRGCGTASSGEYLICLFAEACDALNEALSAAAAAAVAVGKEAAPGVMLTSTAAAQAGAGATASVEAAPAAKAAQAGAGARAAAVAVGEEAAPGVLLASPAAQAAAAAVGKTARAAAATDCKGTAPWPSMAGSDTGRIDKGVGFKDQSWAYWGFGISGEQQLYIAYTPIDNIIHRSAWR